MARIRNSRGKLRETGYFATKEQQTTIYLQKKRLLDQVDFEQGATFLGRNFNYAHDLLGTSLEFTKIGGGWSGEVALLRNQRKPRVP